MAKPDSEDSTSLSGQFGRLIFSAPGIAVLLAVTSLLVGSFGFRLARTASESQVQSDVSDLLRFESRMWQDPIQFLTAEKVRNGKVRSLLVAAVEQNWEKLAGDFFSGTSFAHTNAVLFVINNHSPFPQGVEIRLRNRVAVLAALRAAGLFKKGADETRFVSSRDLPGLPSTDLEAISAEELKLVPGEVFGRDGSVQSSSPRYEHVMVFWLPERQVKEHPWDTLQFLANKLLDNRPKGSSATNLQVGVVGPRTSDGLFAWFRSAEIEYARTNKPHAAVTPYFASLKVVSTSARAPDAFYEFRTNGTATRLREGAEKALQTVFTNCSFAQFGGTDDRLCFALAAELALRGVDVTRDKILLLSEYDTFYGRSLPLTFKSVVATLAELAAQHQQRQYPTELMGTLPGGNWTGQFSPEYTGLLARFQTNLFELRTNDLAAATNVMCFTYLAGLDGSRTVADNSKEKEGPAKSNQASDNPVELPAGEQQLDYTKRLAYSLNRKMTATWETFSTNGPVKAVGLLGSDVYDKMLMLQALRSRLPDCIFFTTELDARYTMPSQTGWTRNLITASGFDLLPPHQSESLGFAPFRDGYQTAAYLGCLSFLTGRTDIQTEDLATYEIGRTVPHRLAAPQPNLLPHLISNFLKIFRVSSWQEAIRNISNSPALVVGIAVFFFFGLIVATVFPARHTSRGHWLVVLLSIALICLTILFIVLWIFRDGLEPMTIGDGVSALPSAVLLLMATAIGGYGLWRTDRAEHKILAPDRAGGGSSKMPTADFGFVLCILGMLGLVWLVFLWRNCPMRSPNEWWLRGTVILAWSVSGSLCVATAFIWRAFLKQIQTLVERAETLANLREPQSTPESFFPLVTDATEMARRVEQFGPLSYFPMCTLLLLVLANSSWLDAWHTTIWIVLLLAAKIMILVTLPMLVHQKARQFKRVLSHQLELDRLRSLDSAEPHLGVGEKQEAALAQLNRGCFAPISQQPVLGALASLLGGSGLVTLLQQFLAQ